MKIKNKFKNNQGQSLLTTIMGVIIVGIILLSLSNMCLNMQAYKNKDDQLMEIKILSNNLKEQIRNEKYTNLTNKYSNKIFTNLNDKYIVKTTIDTKNPCNNNICDLTLVYIKIYNKENILVESTFMNRAYTHFASLSQINYSGGTAELPLNGIIKVNYKIWGAGGGTGGNDQSPGSVGGSAGAITGIIDNSEGKLKQIDILVGQAGIAGGSGLNNGSGAEAAAYGGGGKGGGTGWYGYSGGGASGGGRTTLYLDTIEFSTAGGGGGGGGGSYNRSGLQGSLCSTQIINNYIGGKGETSPVDGGGGGGGGGGHNGGQGGHYGADESRGGINAAGGCYGGSFSIDPSATIYNPWGSTPGNNADINRGVSGSPGQDGKAILIIEKESDSSI